jgi:hypothetical protein
MVQSHYPDSVILAIPDQSDNFKWKPDTGTFYAKTINGVPAYRPNRYAYKNINLDPNRSFVIQWDQKVINGDGYGISHFGVMSDDLLVEKQLNCFNCLIPKSTINFAYGYNHNTGLKGFSDFTIVDNTGYNYGGGGSSSPWMNIGTWYTVSFEYNKALNVVDITYKERDTNIVVRTGSYLLSPSGSTEFDNSMSRIGIGHDPMGVDTSLIWGLDPTDYQETEYDNIKVEYLN